jgi:hypothetical protein
MSTNMHRVISLLQQYNSDDFRPDEDAADGVTVGVLWMKDAHDELSEFFDRLCQDCEGRGVVDNPDARWHETAGAPGYHTGVYETNDPEEVECPVCNGVGFMPPPRPHVQHEPLHFVNDEEPF